MKFKNRIILLTIVSLGLPVFAQINSDNTRVNERDSLVNEVTADQQTMKKSDTNLTAQIRQDIMKQGSLSTYAQNVKIITIDGKVTLKGPVRSVFERNSLLKHARARVGASNVINEMSIVSE